MIQLVSSYLSARRRQIGVEPLRPGFKISCVFVEEEEGDGEVGPKGSVCASEDRDCFFRMFGLETGTAAYRDLKKETPLILLCNRKIADLKFWNLA